ncbi:hypothetical protein Hypma_006295 [Hypsizygus marmoreus]|uniref:Uncharacterized protein n=1 Tax=Hypsizygus marmoreus TaxID=39966 RepID=A0A369K246_HYPMA|nr:hypothetical protein Hypma_006295 [Hypsizygus marmoreus]
MSGTHYTSEDTRPRLTSKGRACMRNRDTWRYSKFLTSPYVAMLDASLRPLGYSIRRIGTHSYITFSQIILKVLFLVG